MTETKVGQECRVCGREHALCLDGVCSGCHYSGFDERIVTENRHLPHPSLEPKMFDLIHHGSPNFDPAKFNAVVDDSRTAFTKKPFGGLWTSPVESKCGWREWCEVEEFKLDRLSASFDLRFIGDVLVIDRVEDLSKIPWKTAYSSARIREEEAPVFGSLLSRGVDAIHLTDKGQCATRLSDPRNLYGWDCESVLVINPYSVWQIVHE